MTVHELSYEVYNLIFNLLDAEPRISGELAGKLATECQDVVEHGLLYEDLNRTPYVAPLANTTWLTHWYAQYFRLSFEAAEEMVRDFGNDFAKAKKFMDEQAAENSPYGRGWLQDERENDNEEY